MAHLIVPIEVEGVTLCCNPATRRTDAVLLDSAQEIGVGEWEVYRASASPGDPTTNPEAESAEIVNGGVVFGVCCATQVVLEISGEIETLNSEFDNLQVLLNGIQATFYESVKTTNDPWDRVAVGPYAVTLDLSDRPCGNIIRISGSTVDKIANNECYWDAKIVSIT